MIASKFFATAAARGFAKNASSRKKSIYAGEVRVATRKALTNDASKRTASPVRRRRRSSSGYASSALAFGAPIALTTKTAHSSTGASAKEDATNRYVNRAQRRRISSTPFASAATKCGAPIARTAKTAHASTRASAKEDATNRCVDRAKRRRSSTPFASAATNLGALTVTPAWNSTPIPRNRVGFSALPAQASD